jgi:predicted metal-dependent phosphoesterase TrpH
VILDLHIHSNFSNDSLASPEGIIRAARKKGISGIAVADHNTISGALEAQKACAGGNLIVIVASEISTDKGDIVGLFLNEDIKSRICGEVIDQIHAQGALAILPHPYKHREPDDDIARKVDAIEVFNSRLTKDRNLRASELAKRLGKPSVAGSDAHFCREVGRGRTVASDGMDLRKAILSMDSHIEGEYTSRLLEAFGQIVKSARTRRFLGAPRSAASSLFSKSRKR